MFKKDLVQGGDFLLAIPVSIHITLQYNESGNLEKVFTGFKDVRETPEENLMDLMISYRIIPAKIHVTGGTTWIEGVLYTSTLYPNSGKLPYCMQTKLIEKFMENPEQFNFFAGTVNSTATNYIGSNLVRQCLQIDKFHLLPGWIVPVNCNSDQFDGWIHSDLFPYNEPIITDYIIFRKSDVLYYNVGLSSYIVDRIKKFVDINGYLKAKVFRKPNYDMLVLDYSEIVSNNIHPGSMVVTNTKSEIVYTDDFFTKNAPYSRQTTCLICGKPYMIPEEGLVQCTDPHCKSKLVPQIQHFLHVLNMTTLSAEVILEKLKNDEILGIPDLFLLPEYKDTRVECTLSSLMRALVPVSLIPTDEIFTIFANACNNNEKTFRYYLHHITNIETDLSINHPDINAFISFISDPYNVSDITTLLDSIQIDVIASDKKFDGAPIFRDKTIYITGSFKRGSLTDIVAILNSYSANTTTSFTDLANCVVVGAIKENIDGKAIKYARNLNIPIIDEDTFFTQYDIDTDVAYAVGQ